MHQNVYSPAALVVQLLNLLLVSVLVGGLICCALLLIRRVRKRDAVPVKAATIAPNTLGEILRQQRVAHKMTQEFVAASLGVSRQAVSKWESGASVPSTANLMALASLYGVAANELLKSERKT